MDRIEKSITLGRENVPMNFYNQVLTDEQRRVLELLAPVMTRNDFYLAGGTAIALHLGHRRSVDLGWFTGKPISDALQLAETIKENEIPLTVRSVEKGTLNGDIHGVRVTFLEYRYPHLTKPIRLPKPGCNLASLDDLCAMKLSAIAQRGFRKDFIDIYALLKRHESLKAMISVYRKKYQITDIAHLLYALAYFSDAENEPMPVLVWDIEWEAVKETIRKQIKSIAK
ncbi:MAG: nucleotidyl transferase AbiEii/AbiGii toxin family protein [bacterium]